MAGDYAAGMKLLLSMKLDHGEPLFHFKIKEMKERGDLRLARRVSFRLSRTS